MSPATVLWIMDMAGKNWRKRNTDSGTSVLNGISLKQ
jgi:hypothetical protein